MDKWCNANCPLFCPQTHCICSTELQTSRRIVAASAPDKLEFCFESAPTQCPIIADRDASYSAIQSTPTQVSHRLDNNTSVECFCCIYRKEAASASKLSWVWVSCAGFALLLLGASILCRLLRRNKKRMANKKRDDSCIEADADVMHSNPMFPERGATADLHNKVAQSFGSSNPMFGGVTTRISERSHF